MSKLINLEISKGIFAIVQCVPFITKTCYFHKRTNYVLLIS